MKALHLVLPLALAMLAGCSKNIQNNDAVKQGIVNHLSQNKGLQLASMDLEVTTVTFKDNKADATVSIKPKGAAASAGMQMHYTLEKSGDTWVVQKKADAATHGGGMGGAMPGGMPGGVPTIPEGMGSMAPAAQPPAGALPPGHPPAGAPKK